MSWTARARNVAVVRSVPGALKTSAVLSGLCGNIDKKKDENILDIAQFMLNQLCGLMQEDKETLFFCFLVIVTAHGIKNFSNITSGISCFFVYSLNYCLLGPSDYWKNYVLFIKNKTKQKTNKLVIDKSGGTLQKQTDKCSFISWTRSPLFIGCKTSFFLPILFSRNCFGWNPDFLSLGLATINRCSLLLAHKQGQVERMTTLKASGPGEPGPAKGKLPFAFCTVELGKNGVKGLCQAPFCRINISASVRKDKEKPWHKRNSMSWHFWPKPSSAFCNYMCSTECGVNDQGRGQLDVNQQADCDSVDRHLCCQSRGEREWTCVVLDVAQLLLAEITLRSLGLCCELTYRLEVLKGGLL